MTNWGVLLPTFDPLRLGEPFAVAQAAQLAEQSGYSSIWVGDHLKCPAPVLDAPACLAVAAAVTTRAQLGFSVMLLGLRPLAWAAKQVATLQHLSGNRLRLGVGVGGEFPPEFAATGVPLAGRGARTDEALEVLLRLLSGERVTAEGEYGSLQDLYLDPPAVQRPRPPLWVGGRKTPAMRRAGRFADVWMPYMVSPESFARSLAQARVFAAQAQRPETSLTGAVFIWGSVDADPARARREAVESVSAVYRQDFEPLADRYLLHGDPDMVVARLAEYQAAGADTVIFSAACAPERRPAVTALFAESVLPRLAG